MQPEALLPDGFIEIIEGETRLMVPGLSIVSKVPPKLPAFFNPAAKLSRDMSIAVYKSFVPCRNKEKTFADALAGVGSRGIRVAREVPQVDQVYLNDVNPNGMATAKESARLNGVESRCHFSVSEVCKFLLCGRDDGERFSIVDLDPFGTPARHLDCVLRSVSDGGLISITATDTAVLSGLYPDVCRRRYYGRPLNSAFGNEVSLRLVLYLLALTGSRLDLGIKPVFCHSFQHYLRVYGALSVSNIAANSVLENIGYIKHCFTCGFRSKSENDYAENCPLCGHGLAIGGPLWIGPIYDRNIVANMSGQELNPHCSKVITASSEELPDVPFYYKVDEISKRLRTNPFSVAKVIDKVRTSGYRASRSALNPSGFKTDARLDEILCVLK